MVYVCSVCNTEEEDDEGHNRTEIHRFNLALYNYNNNKHALRGDRHGVQLIVEVVPLNGFEYDFTITPDKKGCYYLNMTPEKFKAHKHEVEFKCVIKNGRTKKEDPIVVTYAGVLHPYESFSMIDPNNNIEQQKFLKLEAGASYEVKVKLTLQENHVSNFKIPIYFSIQTSNDEENKMKSFSIARSIVVAIHNEIHEDIKIEKSPFTNSRWEKVRVIPPTRNYRVISDQFPIPPHYFRTLMFALEKDFGDGVLQEILAKLEPGYVTKENYRDFFHILLWLEEACAIIGLSCYNMENVKLEYKPGDILVLAVPGLAEKRPSVVKGDRIEIKVHNDHTSYQGVIQKVGDKTVDIHFLHDIIVNLAKHCPDMEMDVRFVLGRIHFERMHQGVEQVVLNSFVKNLFPDETFLRRVIEPIIISQNELRNKSIYSNQEQMTAVMKIVNNTTHGAPYIVYGPPGTGKTVTIVEAIYQLKRLKKNIRIMVCAPANAACNMLTEKLATFCTPKELKRIMSENCDTETIHDSINDYCNIHCEDKEKVVVPFMKNDLNKFNIVVTTLVFAGKYTREYHPDVVFIDEAAQAREPEACCAIGLLMDGNRLVLAGDPQQLGPVVHSKICRKYKYDISILERLMDLPIYENDTQNNFITMLKLNFRSHPDVLELPNRMFYGSQLRAVSPSALNDPLAKICVYKLIVNPGIKKNKGAAIEFCSVLSLERREGRSPSYYNPREVLMVYKYIKALTAITFDDPAMKVLPNQIGVVTPYIRQVYKIRGILSKEFHDVEVGTTEAFQGREKRVMLISTVRAQEDLLLYDRLYKLGFVKEPKRFNVAMTRAMSKVIVIGNPLVLSSDTKWNEFIEFARVKGTFCGAPYRERNRQVREDISGRLKNVVTSSS